MKQGVQCNKNQSGQAALEAAIILIAFVVVASVFAFAVLSAGMASTERGEQSIYGGLKVVDSSMGVRGGVVAKADSAANPSTVDSIIFTVSTFGSGAPIRLVSVGSVAGPQTITEPMVIAYRDDTQSIAQVAYTVNWIVGNGDTMLDDGEQAEITADIRSVGLSANDPFTLELKPPTGAVFDISRRIPATLAYYMTLR